MKRRPIRISNTVCDVMKGYLLSWPAHSSHNNPAKERRYYKYLYEKRYGNNMDYPFLPECCREPFKKLGKRLNVDYYIMWQLATSAHTESGNDIRFFQTVYNFLLNRANVILWDCQRTVSGYILCEMKNPDLLIKCLE